MQYLIQPFKGLFNKTFNVLFNGTIIVIFMEPFNGIFNGTYHEIFNRVYNVIFTGSLKEYVFGP